MIQANELRIGNYYMYAGNDGIVYAKVKCIQLNEFGLLSDSNGVNFGICAPIPLTEEWLLKLGFDGDNKYFLTPHNYNLVFQKNGVIKFFGLVFNHKKTKNLIYVHQLQNLYFALTNNELNIQL